MRLWLPTEAWFCYMLMSHLWQVLQWELVRRMGGSRKFRMGKAREFL